MSVTKTLALFAVIIMVACPLAAVMNDADSDASEAKITQDATHIKLTDLDEKDLDELFFEDVKRINDGSVNGAMTTIASGLLFPGLNTMGVGGFDIKTLKINGADLEFDYVRTVNYGESSKVVIAMDVNFKEVSLTFDKTYKGMYMLASDAFMSDDELPADFVKDYKVKVSNEHVELIQTWYRSPGDHEQEIADYKMDFDARVEGGTIPAEYAGQYETEKGMKAYSDDWADDNYMNLYKSDIASLDKTQQFFATGDYGVGIREAYADQKFTGEKLTLTGSVHAKIYLETTVKTQKVDVGKDLEGYVITETGLTPNMILSFIGMGGMSGQSSEIVKIFNYCPLSEVDVSVDADLTLGHNGKEYKYGIDAMLNVKSDMDITYDDINTVLKRSGKGFANDNTCLISLKAMELALDYKSTFQNGNKSHERDIKLDLSETIRKTIDKMFVNLKAEDKISLGPEGDRVKFESWFGFIINPKVKATTDDYTWFDQFEIKYNYFLGMFEGAERMTDAQAYKLITSKGGVANHELSDAQKGIDAVKKSFNSGNGTVDGALLGVIIGIIAIIAMAALVFLLIRTKD